jgi:hypothetical protein
MCTSRTALLWRVIVLSAGIAAGAPAGAATILWGLPTAISADTDVSTTGTLLSAHNIGGPTVTINGVTFPATAFGLISPFFELPTSGELAGFDNAVGSTQPPFSLLSTSYQDLLDSGGATFDPNGAPAPINLLIKNLTVGQVYEFQWWVNDSRSAGAGRTTTATSGSSVTLNHNLLGIDGGVGQFAVGSFLADATTQAVVFQGAGTGMDNGASQISGFQLRLVPEPAALALLALCLPLLSRARTQRPEAGDARVSR